MLDVGWKGLLKDRGLVLSEIVKKAELPWDIFSRKTLSLNIEEYFRIWRAIGEVVDSPCGGLILGKDIPVELFTPWMLSAFSSPNLNVCMERLNQYKRLTGPTLLNVYENENETIVELECLDIKKKLPSFLVAVNFVLFTDLVRRATKKKIKPISVTTQTQLTDKAYIDFFGVIPGKGKTNRICFSKADAQRPFLTENAPWRKFFESDLRQRLVDLDEDASHINLVRNALLKLLPTRQMSIDNVANMLGVSKRDLQRCLSKESTTFQKVLNQVREGLARHYLINLNMSNAEISFLIGFDDPNSFGRAFQHWTGKTPQEIRKEKIII
ncbi:MAG: AraC family transcriptional regulator [Desulfobacteraceae bacterium]|nr:AraC family transcriptional regulator [Desulfobacteraceae bacterium]